MLFMLHVLWHTKFPKHHKFSLLLKIRDSFLIWLVCHSMYVCTTNPQWRHDHQIEIWYVVISTNIFNHFCAFFVCVCYFLPILLSESLLYYFIFVATVPPPEAYVNASCFYLPYIIIFVFVTQTRNRTVR